MKTTKLPLDPSDILRILVKNSDDPDDLPEVNIINLHGDLLASIPRGKESLVQRRYVELLARQKTDVYVMDEEGNKVLRRSGLKNPFVVVHDPAKEI